MYLTNPTKLGSSKNALKLVNGNFLDILKALFPIGLYCAMKFDYLIKFLLDPEAENNSPRKMRNKLCGLECSSCTAVLILG